MGFMDNPEYFRCRRFNCTMLKIRCVQRRNARLYGSPSSPKLALASRFLECQNCEQGKAIEREMGPAFLKKPKAREMAKGPYHTGIHAGEG